MSEPKQPGVSLRLRVTRDVGTDDKTYSTRPYAGTMFTEGRVRRGGWGPIRRELSDDSGQPRMSTASVLLNDDDGVLREALAEDETRFIESSEADLTVLSGAGRTAALEDRSLMRCKVQNASVEIARNGHQRMRSVRVDLIDALAPYYDRNILQARFLRADYPDIHRDLENTFIPVVMGEHSDAGAEDVNGNSAEKGLVPAIHVGSRRNVFDDPTLGTPSFLAAPGLSYVINGTPGTTTRYYGATSRSASGESLLSAILVVPDAPAVLNGTDNVEITIAPVTDATGQVIYGRRNPTPVRRLAELSGVATTFIDDGTLPEYAPGPPETNTAQIASVEDDYFWDFYVYALGYVPIVRLFGSNVQVGVEPARIDITATEGVDFIEYHGVIGGNEVSGFYARGPRSQHHIDGIVTFAIQTCGVEDVGDGSGDSIQKAFYQLQHVLNEYVLKNNGEGYRSGLYGPLETFDDGSPGTPMLQTSKFEACQDLTGTWLGGSPGDVGYKGAIYLREPLTVRQFLQQWFQTFDAFGAVNHHGQFYPVLVDPDADVADGRIYRERIELLSIENPQLDKDHVEPGLLYQYDFDPDADRFRSEIIPVGTISPFQKPAVKMLRYTRDAATAEDAMERRVARLFKPRWRQTIVTKYLGLENELGDQIRVTHADGPSLTGWQDRPFFVTSHVVDPNRGEVRLSGYDVLGLLTGEGPAEGFSYIFPFEMS